MMKNVIFLLILLISGLHATDWFIDAANGDNSNSGRSVDQAFAHFYEEGVLAVWDSLSAGDIVYIFPGVYDITGLTSAVNSAFSISKSITETTPVIWYGVGDNVIILNNSTSRSYIEFANQIFYNLVFKDKGYSSGPYISNHEGLLTVNTTMKFLDCEFYIDGEIVMKHVAPLNPGPYGRFVISNCLFTAFSNLLRNAKITYDNQLSVTYFKDESFIFTNNTVYFYPEYIHSAYLPFVLNIRVLNSANYLELKIENNIFHGGENSGSEKTGVIYFPYGSESDYLEFSEKNNLFWNSDTSGDWSPIKFVVSGDAEIDASSMVAVPKFVDPSYPAQNFKLKPLSPALFMQSIPGCKLPSALEVYK